MFLATWPSKTMVFAVVSASHRAKTTAISPFFHVFRYFLNCVGPLYMAIKFFAFFFPTISTFGCFWSQWPTSLAVTSGCPTMRCGRLPSRSDVNIQWHVCPPNRPLTSIISSGCGPREGGCPQQTHHGAPRDRGRSAESIEGNSWRFAFLPI